MAQELEDLLIKKVFDLHGERQEPEGVQESD